MVGSARAREVASRLLSSHVMCSCCSVGVCTLSLAVALGSVALLLFSVVGSEVHQAFPHSAYTQWLDRALFTGCALGGGETNGGWHSHHCHTTGLWNNVFLVSNICLLLLLPFGHFFMEAEGFTWSRKVSTAAAAHASCPAHPVCPAPAPGPVVQGVRVLSGGGTDGGVAGAGGLGGLLPLAARQHPK